MYKYFKELDNPNTYKIYLSKHSWDIKKECRFFCVPLTNEFFFKHKDLLERFKVIDKLVEGYNETLAYKETNLSYEEWLYRNDYFSWRNNSDYEGLEIEEKKDFDTYYYVSSIKSLLDYYSICCNFFYVLFPNYKEFIASTQKLLEDAINELNSKIYPNLPKNENRMVELIWPNGWFITPNGYLYNPGFENGHKEGSLLYSFHNIRELLENNKQIPNINYRNKVAEILKRGYVTEMQFQNYANLIYSLPPFLLTGEQLYTIECYKNIMENKKETEDFKTIILPKGKKIVEIKSSKEEPMIKINYDFKRSYQPNIVNLVVGYLNAKTCFYDSFRRLNNSNKKSELLKKIYSLSWKDYNDILIKFGGFHKIETGEKKITTSSLYGIDLFKNYLEKGWYLYIVPPIVYDAYLDDIAELDFHSYYVSNHFDKVLRENSEFRRILIKNVNC